MELALRRSPVTKRLLIAAGSLAIAVPVVGCGEQSGSPSDANDKPGNTPALTDTDGGQADSSAPTDEPTTQDNSDMEQSGSGVDAGYEESESIDPGASVDDSADVSGDPGVSDEDAEQLKDIGDCYGYPAEGFSSEEEEAQATAQVSQEEALACIEQVTGKDLPDIPTP